jgi:hypothetical protein
VKQIDYHKENNDIAGFQNTNARELTLYDLLDFLKRSKWKTYQRRNRRERVGNYLSIIDPKG